MTTRTLRRTAIRAAAVLVAAAALVLGGAGIAAAHVTVSPSSTEGGSRTILTFRVPTESDSAETVGLTITFPTDTPFSSVRVKPVAGWTAQVIRQTLDTPVTDAAGNTITSAVTQIVWTTADAGIGPDEYGEFEVSASPLPAEGTVYFPTVQSYSDGSEVDWVQQAEGDTEPEYPAPSVEVVAAGGTVSADEHSAGTDGASVTAAPVAEASATAPDAAPLAVGVVALVIALLAAGGAGFALARTRPRSRP